MREKQREKYGSPQGTEIEGFSFEVDEEAALDEREHEAFEIAGLVQQSDRIEEPGERKWRGGA